MKEFVERIEDFFFDFLGLIVPGFFLLLLITTPLLLLDIKNVNSLLIEESSVLTILTSLTRYVEFFFNNPTEVIVVLIFLLSYIIGHLIKVLSVVQYQFLAAIFDKFLLKILDDIVNHLSKSPKIANIKSSWNVSQSRKYISTIIKELVSPFRSLCNKLFTFKSPDYFPDNEILKDSCIEIINQQFETEFPNKWYSLYKFSTIINKQENLKSLSLTFLAKYNFYRSMAFIFTIIFFYYLIFFKASKKILNENILALDTIIFIGIILLWFTFHYKYKRYWTLCGNETLVSLYYYLKKSYKK